MTNVTPEPVPIEMRAPAPAVGHWLVRACRAVLVERRLPTRLRDSLDRAAIAFGSPCRTLTIPDPDGGSQNARLRVRRRTADCFFVEEVFQHRAYSPSGYEIDDNDIVIDVGGNVGSFAIFAGRRARRGRVISIEPARDSFDLLTRNVAMNRLNHVSLIRAAIASKTGPATLHLSASGTGHHSLDRLLAGQGRVEQVEGRTLATVFEEAGIQRCDLLKLDCEGAEFEIWETIPPAIAGRIRRVALEYHTRPGSAKRQQADALARRLVELGYCIDRYEDHLGTNRGMIFARRD